MRLALIQRPQAVPAPPVSQDELAGSSWVSPLVAICDPNSRRHLLTSTLQAAQKGHARKVGSCFIPPSSSYGRGKRGTEIES